MNVFIFHRVLPRPDPLFPTDLHAERFEGFLRFLRGHFTVLPLLEVIRRLNDGTLPTAAACITFDDGYADNWTVAAPLMARYQIPATVFVAPAFLNGGRMWNDTVIESVRRSTRDVLDLRAMGMRALPIQSAEQRREAIAGILSTVKHLPMGKRLEMVDEISKASGASLPSDLMMSSDQVRALALSGIEIGAHTRHHPILACETAETARQEIIGSKHDLEELLQVRVDSFAYPNGRPNRDYRPEHAEMVKEAGFQCAVSTEPGVVTPRSRLFELPRFTPWSRSLPEFAWRLGVHLFNSRERETMGALS